MASKYLAFIVRDGSKSRKKRCRRITCKNCYFYLCLAISFNICYQSHVTSFVIWHCNVYHLSHISATLKKMLRFHNWYSATYEFLYFLNQRPVACSLNVNSVYISLNLYHFQSLTGNQISATTVNMSSTTFVLLTRVIWIVF